MSRRPAVEPERFKRLLKAVCDDLGCKPDSEQARHVATLRLARENIQIRLLARDSINPDHLLKLEEVLRQFLPKQDTPEIRINVVETVRGRCPHCGQLSEVSFEPFENEPRQRHPDLELEAKVRAATPAPEPVEPPPPPPPVQYRDDVPSDFHAAVIGPHRITAPLKRDQPGVYDMLPHVTSPMSYGVGNGPEPRRRRDAPGGSAFDDPNPNRKLS